MIGSQLIRNVLALLKAPFVGPEPDETPRSAYLNLIEVARVSRWGVDSGRTAAENRAALQKAINSGTRRELVFAEGDYKVNDLLTVPGGSIIYVAGQGAGVTRLMQTDMTKGLLQWNAAYAQGGGLRAITLASDVAAGARGSSGIGLQVINANDNFVADHFSVESFDKCVRVDGSFQPSFNDFRFIYFADYGLYLSPYSVAGTDTAGTRWRNGKISNYGYLGANPENSVGMLIEQGSGEFFDTIDITQTGRSVVVAPPAGSFARFLKFNTILADTSYYEGWTVDGANAPVLDVRMVNSWASGSGGGAARPAGSTRGAGLLTKGANLDDLAWVGGEIRDNDVHGWDHQGGTHCRLIGASVTRNSRRVGFDNTYYGVRIAPNVSDWAVLDCDIGNFSEGVFGVTQLHGIVIEAGASENFRISGNDLRSPGSGGLPIVNGSTSLNFIISDNLPQQFPGTNVQRGANLTGVSGGTIAAGSTLYLGPLGAEVNEADAYMMIGRPGLVSQLVAEVDAAPGASQSFTFTVRNNNVDTVMTGAISGAGSFQLVLDDAFVVSPADRLSIRVAASAGAAAARVRWVLNIEA